MQIWERPITLYLDMSCQASMSSPVPGVELELLGCVVQRVCCSQLVLNASPEYLQLHSRVPIPY